jgi:hypothetical protein
MEGMGHGNAEYYTRLAGEITVGHGGGMFPKAVVSAVLTL